MNKKEIEQKIRLAAEDPSSFGEPLIRRVLENIFSHPRDAIDPVDHIPFYILSLFSAKILLEAYPSSQLMDLARGLLLLHIRFFDSTYSGKSTAVVFQVVQEGEAGLIKRLYAHFADYAGKDVPAPIPEADLANWMIHQIGSVDTRTAERHYNKALDIFYKRLIKVVPEWGENVPQATVIPSLPAVSIPEFDLLPALKQFVREESTFAPPFLNCLIPIPDCIHPSLFYEAERISVDEMPGALRDRHGIISGIPGSGRSTLLKQIAYQDASYKDNGQCIYVLPARYIQDPANVDDPLLSIARHLSARHPQVDRKRIREGLRQLDENGGLILLIDDLDDLLQHQQRRVVERVAILFLT